MRCVTVSARIHDGIELGSLKDLPIKVNVRGRRVLDADLRITESYEFEVIKKSGKLNDERMLVMIDTGFWSIFYTHTYLKVVAGHPWIIARKYEDYQASTWEISLVVMHPGDAIAVMGKNSRTTIVCGVVYWLGGIQKVDPKKYEKYLKYLL
mgnify:CR=1 FL=1